MLQKIRSNRKGVTLLELLVASVIALIATGAALEVYINQQRNWLAQENITDMQQNGRAAVDEIVYHLRQAGYHIPQGLEALYATNTDPDSLTIVYLSDPICEASLTDSMSMVSSEIELDPDSIGCFDADTWAFIYDPITETGEFFLITGVEVATGHIQHTTMDLSREYPGGSIVYLIDVVTFYVDNTTDSLHPRLMIQRQDGVPHIYADNIEDLQFSYTMTHGAVVDSFVASRLVREVNVTVVARTERADFIKGEDFVRDTFSTSVFLRNLSF